jgi:Tol biopolymer transport system component
MTLATGTRIGVYEIVGAIGAGGMGEVYRARDTRLDRSVAIKILPELFMQDPERLARFEREAKTLAALNHPNIATIHGFEEANGIQALVMELIEGPTLADRIAQGPIPIDEALPIATQIAEALEAAHETGVVHRDLKPTNVKITPDGKVKVLDFGLAKAMDSMPAAASLTQSPTLSIAATQAGVILGTAAYMSPEQARGFAADQRSDVFSFGCVLYEMLTGRQLFRGETVADVLGAVLVAQPDLDALPPNLNPRLPELLRRCLEKNPKRRWQAVGDLRFELEVVAAAPRSATVSASLAAAPKPLWKRSLPVALGMLVVGVLTGVGVWNFRPSAPPPIVMRFQIKLDEGQEFRAPGRQVLAMSPNGTSIVYAANQQLYFRPMSDLEARPLLGEGSLGVPVVTAVTNPVFSPDGQTIAFWSAQTLKRIAITGGVATTICPADTPYGMSWGADGIVFGQGPKGIMRVSADGGTPERLVSVKDDEVAYGPQMMPDGQTLLFTLAKGGTRTTRWDGAQIVAQSLRSNERKIVITGGSDARYLPTRHLVYAVGGVLFAVPFDPTRLQVTGGPVPILEGVRRSIGGATGVAHFSVSQTGSLVYLPGPVSTAGGPWDLALIDRRGNIEPLNLPSISEFLFPRVSPDGKRIAFAIDDGDEANISIYDLSRTSAPRRLTFGGKNRFPIWSADGRRVAFQSDREGDLGIFWQPADGTGTAERLTKPDPGTSHVPESWSPKGDRLLFGVTNGRNTSLWAYSLQDKRAAPFGDIVSTVPITSVFSPNGQWVAYGSVASGANAIYVQQFPNGAKYQVSRIGNHPVWSPDGKELIYNPAPNQLSVVPMTTQPTVAFGNPVSIPRPWVMFGAAYAREYDITRDGRFLGVVPTSQSTSGDIHVVISWVEELKRRVPTN